jgi:hypothetical protein
MIEHPETLDVFPELRMRRHLAVHHRGGRYAPHRAIAIPVALRMGFLESLPRRL